MRSLVQWALLGLVIDRPSYAYELAQRFERTYEDAVSLSSVSHVYLALGALKERVLIEEIGGSGTERQPKPHYRATAIGIERYGDWLVEQICEERQRRRLFVLGLGAFTRDPEKALEVIDRFEAACLREAARAPLLAGADAGEGSSSSLMEQLLNEENKLAAGAKLEWLHYARERLNRLAKTRHRR
jgi:DNA-binding PadR family transcriptional regulator